MEIKININDYSTDLKPSLDALRALDNSFTRSIVDPLITNIIASSKGVEVTDHELQTAIDEYRYITKFESAEQFNQHLKDIQVSLDAFQLSIENILLRNKIIDSVSDSEIDAYIAENQLSMERVEFNSMRLSDENQAQEIKQLVVEDDESFLALAEEHSKDETTAKKGGYVGLLSRSDLTAEIEAAVFGASEGDVIGPIKTDAGYNLFKIIKFHKPHKDDSTLRWEIKEMIFQQELDDYFENADISCDLF